MKPGRYVLSGTAGPWLDYYEELNDKRQAKLVAIDLMLLGYKQMQLLDTKTGKQVSLSLRKKRQP